MVVLVVNGWSALAQPAAATEPPRPPRYGWHADERVETESVSPACVMMGARVYLSFAGRFTSPDPKPGVSGSDYGYAHADPINSVDPDGTSAKGWRAFENWSKTDFVDFWKDDIPKAWNWSFGSGATWQHTFICVLVIVIVIVVLVIIAIVVLVTVLTDGADLDLTPLLDSPSLSDSMFS
jgi:RHS repeat-associated protein